MSDILLLDDDDDFTRLLKHAVEARGHHVHIARTGKAATQMVEQLKPAAVIVDGLLPDTDGVRWIERFRQTSPDTPAILISAFGYAKDAKTAQRLTRDLRVGLVATKPLELDRFIADFQRLVPDDELPVIEEVFELSELEAEFQAELPAKLAALRAAFQSFAKDGAAEAYTQALQIAHRLHGSAGMYGFDALSQNAGRLEAALREMDPSVIGRADPSVLAGLGQILQQLG